MRKGSTRSSSRTLYQLCAIALSLVMVFVIIVGTGLGFPEDELDIFEDELYICECYGECQNIFDGVGEEEYEPEYEPYICKCEGECENLPPDNNEGDNEGGEYETVPTEPETDDNSENDENNNDNEDDEYDNGDGEDETQPTEPEEPSEPGEITFTFDGALILEMTELHPGADLNEIVMRGVTAVDEGGEDITHLIFVADDGGFGYYVNNTLAGIIAPGGDGPGFGGLEPEPIDPGSDGFAGLNDELFGFELLGELNNDEGQFAFFTQITYALVHPDSGELILSEPRDLAVNFMGFSPAVTGAPTLPAGPWQVINVTTAGGHAALSDAILGPTGGTHRIINIQGHITQTNQISIPAGRHIAIASNGTNLTNNTGGPASPFVITLSTTLNGHRHFSVANTASLTLSNIILDGGSPTGTAARGGILVHGNGNTTSQPNPGRLFIRHANTRIRNNRHFNGGAISAYFGGRIYMFAGEIHNNFAMTNGGGIHLGGDPGDLQGGGHLIMSGGTIRNNTVVAGGGGTGGGGIVVGTPSSVSMTGGSITGNTSATRGGGVDFHGRTFTMSGSASITGNTATGTGGGVFVSPASNGTTNFTMSAGSITGNTAGAGGGGVFVQQGTAINTTFNFNGGSISNNRSNATGFNGGGGIHMASGNLSFGAGSQTISNNSAANQGGGIWSAVGFTISANTTISGNWTGAAGGGNPPVSTSGGGIFMNAGILSMTGGTISGNRSGTGGGVMLLAASQFNMSGGTIGGAGAAARNTSQMQGGGVRRAGTGQFTMSSTARIENNLSGSDGGGVFIDGGTFNYNGGTFHANRSNHRGGAVHASAGTTFTFSTGTGSRTVSNNSAATQGNVANTTGGGVHRSGTGAMTMNNINARIEHNNAVTSGAGVHWGGTATLSMSNGVISSNRVGAIGNVNSIAGTGGGVHIASGVFTMSGGTIGGATTAAGNRAGTGGGVHLAAGTFNYNVGSISNNRAGTNGGGIHAAAGTFTFNTGTGSRTVNNNSAGSQGGGIWSAVDFTIPAGTTHTIHSNWVGNEAGTTLAGTGGGIHMNGGTLTMNGGTIGGATAAVGNRAGSGGGVNLNLASNMTMSGATAVIRNNNAATGGGGVMRAGTGTFTMSGGTISENRVGPIAGGASGTGGGVSVSGGTFTMDNGTIGGATAVGNRAGEGGGVAFSAGTFDFNNGTISGNSAETGGGGGIHMSSSNTLTMAGGQISGNSAVTNGGGVNTISSGTFTMNGGTIGGTTVAERNTATSGGGGVFIGGGFPGTFNFNNGTISGNRANGSGGGINLSTGATFNFHNTGAGTGNRTISNNSAASFGGGISSNTPFTIPAGTTHTISGNWTGSLDGTTISGWGGGAFVAGLTMYGGTISGNRSGNGGGLGMWGSMPFTMNGGTIDGNSAILTVAGGSGAGNGHGGGVYRQGGGAFNFNAGTISNNRADTNGGGIHVINGATFTFHNTGAGTGNRLVTGNSAGLTGGGIFGSAGFTIPAGTTHTISNNWTGNAAGTTISGTGGGIHMQAGTLTMQGGTISGNRAGNGGGVNLTGFATLTMTGGTIGGAGAGNTAVNGGGIHRVGTGSISLSQTARIQGNTATGNGGGIWVIAGGLPNVTTSNTVVFTGNSATPPTDYGMSRGIADFPNLNWAAQNSRNGTRTGNTGTGVHLLNNYDIYNDGLQWGTMSIEISHSSIFFGTHGSNWIQRQRAPIRLGETGTGYSPAPASLALTVENGLALTNWHVTVNSGAPTSGPQAGVTTLSNMLVVGTGANTFGFIHGTSTVVYAYTAVGTPSATRTIGWNTLITSNRDVRVDIQSNSLGTLVDGVTYSAELTWTLVQGAP